MIWNTLPVSPIVPRSYSYVPRFLVLTTIFSIDYHNAPILLMYFHYDHLSTRPIVLPILLLIAAMNPHTLWCSGEGKYRASCSNYVVLVNHSTNVSIRAWLLCSTRILCSHPTTIYDHNIYYGNLLLQYPGSPCPHYMFHLGL